MHCVIRIIKILWDIKLLCEILPCDIWKDSPPVANIKLLIIPNKATDIASQMPATATINVGIPFATP